jgi:hypothetical protein
MKGANDVTEIFANKERYMSRTTTNLDVRKVLQQLDTVRVLCKDLDGVTSLEYSFQGCILYS